MSATRAEFFNEQIKKLPPLQATSDDLRKRAKHYRLAAALADVPGEAAMLNDLAMMFDQISYLVEIEVGSVPRVQVDEAAEPGTGATKQKSEGD